MTSDRLSLMSRHHVTYTLAITSAHNGLIIDIFINSLRLYFVTRISLFKRGARGIIIPKYPSKCCSHYQYNSRLILSFPCAFSTSFTYIYMT